MEYGGSYLCVCHTDHNASRCEGARGRARGAGGLLGNGGRRKAGGTAWASCGGCALRAVLVVRPSPCPPTSPLRRVLGARLRAPHHRRKLTPAQSRMWASSRSVRARVPNDSRSVSCVVTCPGLLVVT